MRKKYIVSATLNNHSFATRKKLNALGFSIFYYDKLTNLVTVPRDDYSKPEKVIDLDDATCYHALYNGESLPIDNIQRILEDDASVLSYSIEKRVY